MLLEKSLWVLYHGPSRVCGDHLTQNEHSGLNLSHFRFLALQKPHAYLARLGCLETSVGKLSILPDAEAVLPGQRISMLANVRQMWTMAE